MQMNPKRITRKIIKFFKDRGTVAKWISGTRNNLISMGVEGVGIQNRNMFRKKIREFWTFLVVIRDANI